MIGRHTTIDGKIGILETFMVQFKQRFTFFQSIIDDKKSLEEKVVALEVKLNQKQDTYGDKEVVHLREQVVKLTNDLEEKKYTIKTYEEMQKKSQSKKKPDKSIDTEGNYNRIIYINNINYKIL